MSTTIKARASFAQQIKALNYKTFSWREFSDNAGTFQLEKSGPMWYAG